MKEILEALLAGKKIGSEDWGEDEYVYLDDEGHLRDENGYLVNGIDFILVNDFDSNTNMFVYEEPKKKAELFLWAAPGGQGFYTTLKNNFMTEEEAKLIIGEDAIKTNISITVEI